MDNTAGISRENLLVLLVVILIAATAIQGFFLYKMYTSKPASRAVAQQPTVVPDDEVSLEYIKQPMASVPPMVASRNPRTSIGLSSLLTNWDPFAEFQRMEEEMDQLFQDSFNRYKGFGTPGFGLQSFAPDLDIREEGNLYVVEADLPGVDKPDINVQVDDRTLTIAAKTDYSSDEEDNGQVFRQERRIGQYQRSITLPGPVESSKMKATYDKGVLRIEVPKRKPIEIKQNVEVQ